MQDFDIDKLSACLPAWDLVIIIDGIKRPIRPLTLADLASLNSTTDPDALANLFEEPKPDLNNLTVDRATVLMAVIVGFIQTRAKKNLPALMTGTTGQSQRA